MVYIFLQHPVDVCAWPNCPRDRHGVYLGALLHWRHQILCVSNSHSAVRLCSMYRVQCSHVTCSVDENGGEPLQITGPRRPERRPGTRLCSVCLSAVPLLVSRLCKLTLWAQATVSATDSQSVRPRWGPNPFSAFLVTCGHQQTQVRPDRCLDGDRKCNWDLNWWS